VSRTAHFFGGAGQVNPHIAMGARDYAARQGLARPDVSTFRSVVAHPDVTKAAAQAYGALPDFDERAVPHFKAMAHETEKQFDHLTKPVRRGGLGVQVDVSTKDPYKGPADMMRDLHENKHLEVYSTAASGSHPYFSNLQNDQFRAVHDAFGHGGTGRGFDRHGEEAAFQMHSSMYSPTARRAMATETRGQNSAFISAGGGGNFQAQKVALLPAHLAQPITPLVGRRTAAFHSGALAQAREFHSSQFPGAKML
jgi:hypothetical protein